MNEAAPLTRIQLFIKVWQTPVTKAAAEFGLSDSGLRKLCARHDIPLPKRGHWARIEAGQVIDPPKLPNLSDDPTINLRRETRTAPKRAPAAPRLKKLEEEKEPEGASTTPVMRSTLDGSEAIVRRTEHWFQAEAVRIDKRAREAAKPVRYGEPRLSHAFVSGRLNGRLRPTEPGCLHIVATLKSIDWILRFHDALIRELGANACNVRAKQWNESHLVEVFHENGEHVTMSFVEEFETHTHRKPGQNWDTKEYVAKDRYKLKVDRYYASTKTWGGSQEQLSELLPGIAREMATLLVAQAEIRRVRDAEEALRKAAAEKRAEESQRWFAEQALIAERKKAKRAQAGRARSVAEACDQHASTLRLLAELEAQIERGPQDEGVRAWVALGRSSLPDPITSLLKELRAETSNYSTPAMWSSEPDV